jgi:hypothetical protein
MDRFKNAQLPQFAMPYNVHRVGLNQVHHLEGYAIPHHRAPMAASSLNLFHKASPERFHRCCSSSTLARPVADTATTQIKKGTR